MYCCIVEVSEKHYILTDRDGCILGNREEAPLLNYWTKAWEKGLNRGAGWHTGACLSFIQFRPSVVEFVDIPDLKGRIVGERENYELLQVAGDGGWFDGLLCTGTGAGTAWEAGTKPIFFRDDCI